MSKSWVARLVVFVAFLDLFAQLPIVATYARQLGAGPMETAIAVASYDAANLLGNVAAGFVLLGLGKYRTLVVGLAVSGVALATYGLVAVPWQFGLVRAVHGLGQAVLSPGAFTLLSDSVPPGRRAQAMGTAGAFIAIAAVIGPPLSGIVAARLDPAAVFAGIAGLMLAMAALVGVFTRKGDPSEAKEAMRGVRPASLASVLRRPELVVAYAACLAWTAGIGTLVVHLPLLLESRGVGAGMRGTAFGVYALVALVLFARPAPWFANRFGRLRALAVGLALIAAALFGLAVAGTIATVYVAMATFGCGFGLLFPAVTAYIADQTAPNERGLAFGIFYAAYSLGVVVGAVGSGQLAATLGTATVAPFVAFGAVALAVGGLVALRSAAPVIDEATVAPNPPSSLPTREGGAGRGASRVGASPPGAW